MVDKTVELKDEAIEMLPTQQQVRYAVGTTIVLGGKALLNPREALGEAAIIVGNAIKPEDHPESKD